MKVATWIGLTRRKIVQPAAFTPSREPECRLIVGAPGVPVADVGREELPETLRGLRLRQEQRRRLGGDGLQIAGSFEGNKLNRFGVFHHE